VELLVLCIKQAEQGKSLVIRLYNPSPRNIDGSLTLFKAPRSAHYLNLNEEPAGVPDPEVAGNRIALPVDAKKIVTLEIEFD